MSNHFRSLLAVDLSSWWRHLSKNERFFLIALSLIVSVAIPLSVHNINQTTSFNSKAASYGSSRQNKSPTIGTQNLSCRQDEPCSVQIKGSDPDITDELRMEVDFIPSGLALTNCAMGSTLIADLGVTCTLEGTASTKAKYSLLATVIDHQGTAAQAIINLDIR